ncbi:MAG: hypothetical protein C5B59_18430 [Bacteroidetes bacterium]|nr:MAG: hypothetical protein C5B59_18430 [Bacteroidota bacterium]
MDENEKAFNDFWALSDKFDLLCSNYFSEDGLHIREKLNRRDRKINTEDLSYRILNHWEKNGLFKVERGEEGTGWRKFSFVDAVWIQLIVELRKFGVSIENIRHIKEKLLRTTEKQCPSVYPLLEFYCAYFLSFRKPVYFLVFKDFDIQIASQEEIELENQLSELDNHISISLHRLIQGLYKDRKLEVLRGNNLELSSSEMKLILEIRTGAFKSISVKLKNGKIITLVKEVAKVEKELYKILRESNYDEITVKTENGEIKNITHIIKEKF